MNQTMMMGLTPLAGSRLAAYTWSNRPRRERSRLSAR